MSNNLPTGCDCYYYYRRLSWQRSKSIMLMCCFLSKTCVNLSMAAGSQLFDDHVRSGQQASSRPGTDLCDFQPLSID